MGRKAKCPYCNLEIEKDMPFKKYNNRKYHLNCYKKAMNEKYNQNQIDQEPKEELYAYICEVYGTDEVSPMIKSQIEKYMTENKDWKYSGILYVLKYLVEIEKMDIKGNENIKGIGFLPYRYDEAKEYFMMIKKTHEDLNEQLEGRTIDNFITSKVVKVRGKDYKMGKNINIEDL